MPDTSSELVLSIAGALTTASTTQHEVTEAADITDVVAVVSVAPTGADLLLDILKNGTTIFGALGTVAPKSPLTAITGADTLYIEFAGNAAPDIRQGQVLLIDTEQVLVSGQVTGSSKVDAATPVYAVPVTRAQNGTTAAAHAAGASVFPAKPRIPAGTTKSSLTENGPLGVTPTLAPGDVVSVTVPQVGSTVAGSNLDVTLELSQR